jgi:LmbE family N-acetylglucosaminyl deacetylase
MNRTELLRATAPTVTIVAAHPDDEMIGAGVQLRRWRNAHVIYVTDGVPGNRRYALSAGFTDREDYGRARRAEATAALILAGVRPERARWFGFTDQEVSWHMADLAKILAEHFQRFRPDCIVTHPYEGGHPDHDAVACAVYLAIERLRRVNIKAPELVEMTSYHGAQAAMITGEFVPNTSDEIIAFHLSAEEREFKQRLFACYKTQQPVLQYFTLAHERFRTAPSYDFTEPPPGNGVYYQRFDWGMTGERWRELAKKALQEVVECV